MAKARRKFGDKESVAAVGSETALDQKDVEDLEEISPSEAVSPVEEEKLTEKSPSPAEAKPYTVGWWKGFKQWRCNQCAWDTLESEAAMLEHIAVVHGPPPKPKSPILIANKSGRQIN